MDVTISLEDKCAKSGRSYSNRCLYVLHGGVKSFIKHKIMIIKVIIIMITIITIIMKIIIIIIMLIVIN